MSILGLDIGGANIKAADPSGNAVSRPFAIWKTPDRLSEQIESICLDFPGITRLAVTMTAELADCFRTKSEGVRCILNQIDVAAAGRPCDVWTTAGEFVTSADARRQPTLVAAANWHALATWVGRYLGATGKTSGGSPGCSLLIDIGTTTTDIIPLVDGVPVPIGRTDLSRLVSGELCYSGVKRTPLCAVAQRVPFRGGDCPLAAELFATTLDLYLLLGDIADDEHDLETANGRPATQAASRDRIARMLCGDSDEISADETLQIARFLADVQRQRLAEALERVVQRLPGPCERVVISGSGSFLARRLIAGNQRLAKSAVHSLDQILSPAIAEAACAYAVAAIARETPGR